MEKEKFQEIFDCLYNIILLTLAWLPWNWLSIYLTLLLFLNVFEDDNSISDSEAKTKSHSAIRRLTMTLRKWNPNRCVEFNLCILLDYAVKWMYCLAFDSSLKPNRKITPILSNRFTLVRRASRFSFKWEILPTL